MLALLLLPALFSSCRSMTPLDVAARSLVSTVATVDAAMTVYGEAVALGLVTQPDLDQVKILYADYQAAETFAELAITNAKLSGDAGRLASATDALTSVKIPLLQFLARFTTSPP